MATATKQDDDLLIITDEDNSSDSTGDIEFSFDFGDDSSSHKETPENSEVPVDTGEAKAEATLESLAEMSASQDTPEISSAMTDETSENISELDTSVQAIETPVDEDFSFDISDTNTETQTPAKIDQESTMNLDESNLLEGAALTEETSSQEESTLNTNSESSMNEILSATIAKLASRQDVIATSKAWKATKEEEIKAQIKELQSQVSELEADMKELDTESDKITANISELEKMKLDPVKEHNTKRVTKK